MNRAEIHNLSHPITVFVWELLVRPWRGSFRNHNIWSVSCCDNNYTKGFCGHFQNYLGLAHAKGRGKKYNNLQPFHSVAQRLGYLVQLEVLY